MKKIMVALVVALAFQVCTSELSEIDGVIGDHIDGNSAGNGDMFHDIPADSFLGQYFVNDSSTPISSRIENRIRHDFNSPVRNDLTANKLGAKWTGDFYFESGDYNFTINSDKKLNTKGRW